MASPLKRHVAVDKLDRLLIYTQCKPVPEKWDTLREFRTCLRITQVIISACAFSLMYYSSIVARFNTHFVFKSGISLMTVTSLSAFLISFSFLAVYLFPVTFYIPPHRHSRFSFPEIVFDAILIVLWLTSSTDLIVNGACRDSVSSISVCPQWIASSVLGFLNVILFSTTFGMGVLDSQKSKQDNVFQSKDHIMFARGNWKD